jgi:hypothetical protein
MIQTYRFVLQNSFVRLSLFLIASSVGGCSTKIDKAAVGKRVKENVAAASPEWKDITYEGKLDGTITTAGSNRTVNGRTCWFSFTGHDGEGGVAVSEAGKWLAKYSYQGGQEIEAEKMDGADEDVNAFRSVAKEFGEACIKAEP